jgi:hypothetical protein
MNHFEPVEWSSSMAIDQQCCHLPGDQFARHMGLCTWTGGEPPKLDGSLYSPRTLAILRYPLSVRPMFKITAAPNICEHSRIWFISPVH